MTSVAIIGAGIAGLTVAQQLRSHANVTVYEKSRGPGGRIATRYAGDYRFDHGAQFFVARSQPFKTLLGKLQDEGVVAPWCARFAELDGARIAAQREWDSSYPHFVAVPGMNALGKHLATGIDVRLESEVARIERSGDTWRLDDSSSSTLGHFDWVVSTAPAEQAARLLPEAFAYGDALHDIAMLPCFALMLGFAEPLALDWDAALVRNADISWISVNSSKPGRSEAFTLVVHSTNRWAQAHFDDDLAAVRSHLLDTVTETTGHDVRGADHCDLQRWRYANIDRQHGAQALVDHDNRLAACGDWNIRGRVESAFTSALTAAAAIGG